MTKDKILSYANSAFEITKMVLVITTNTAIKLFSEGKKEVAKQYAEYNQKTGHGRLQSEALKKLAAVAETGKEKIKAAEKKLNIGEAGVKGKDAGKTGKK